MRKFRTLSEQDMYNGRHSITRSNTKTGLTYLQCLTITHLLHQSDIIRQYYKSKFGFEVSIYQH